MSFPFTFNNFLPINIKGSNAVTGTFGGVSILNNGKTELRSDTTITRLGINKNVSGSYEMDVSGNVAISTAITVPRITSTNGVSATLLTTVNNVMTVDASGVFSFTSTNPEATFQSFKTLFTGGGLTISQVNWPSIVAMPINAIWTFYIQNNTSGLITVKNSVVSNTAGTFLHAEYANDVIIPNGFNIGIIKIQKIESVEAFIFATPTSNSVGGTIPFTLPTNATFGNLTVSNGFTVGASGAGLFDSSVNMFGEEINVNGGVANGVFRVGNDQLYMGLYDEVFSINNNGEFNVDTMTTNIITFGQFGINAGSDTGTIRMGNDISMNLVDHTMTNNATTTFSILPLCSAVPTLGNQLINKTFSDATYVDLTNNETIGGIKTFTSLPQSSATPTISSQLITKAYADATYSGGGGASLLTSNNQWSGTNTFNNNLTMGTSGYFLPYYPLTNTTLRIGLNVLQNSTALSVNTIAIGNNALQGTTNVAYDNKFIRNIVIGENGLASTIYGTTNTPNNDNVCIGYNVAKGHNLNTTDNVIIGSQCLAGLGAGGTNDSVVIGAKIGVNGGGHTFAVIIGAKNFPNTAINNGTIVGYGNFANSTLSFANTLIIYGDGNMINCGNFNRTICIGSVSLLNFNSPYSAIVVGCETLQGLTTAAGFVSAFGSFITTSNPSLSNTTIIGTFSATGQNNTCYIGGNQSGVYQDLLPANKNKLLTNQTVATNQTLTFESGEHVNITSNAVTTITLPVSIATKNIGTRFILFKNYTTAVSITISSGSDGIRLADNSVQNTYTWGATEQYITLVCVSTTSPMWVIINTEYDDTAVNGDIASLTGDIASLTGDISSLNGYIDSLEQKTTGIGYDNASGSTQISEINTDPNTSPQLTIGYNGGFPSDTTLNGLTNIAGAQYINGFQVLSGTNTLVKPLKEYYTLATASNGSVILPVIDSTMYGSQITFVKTSTLATWTIYSASGNTFRLYKSNSTATTTSISLALDNTVLKIVATANIWDVIEADVLSANNTFSGTNTFSVPPVMSGASIISNTIPSSSVNDLTTLSTTQTISGTKTFTSDIYASIIDSTTQGGTLEIAGDLYLSSARINPAGSTNLQLANTASTISMLGITTMNGYRNQNYSFAVGATPLDLTSEIYFETTIRFNSTSTAGQTHTFLNPTISGGVDVTVANQSDYIQTLSIASNLFTGQFGSMLSTIQIPPYAWLKMNCNGIQWFVYQWTGVPCSYNRRNNATQSIANGSNVTVAFNTGNTTTTANNGSTTWLDGQLTVGGTSPTNRFTNPSTFGIFIRVNVSLTFASNITGIRILWIQPSNTTRYPQFLGAKQFPAGSTGVVGYCSTEAEIYLASNEYFNVFVYQNSGAALNINTNPFIQITKLG